MLVVHDPQVRRTEFRSEFRQGRRRGLCDIDRRLAIAVSTERKVRVELTPELRALFAFVGPVGRVGRRRHGTCFDLRGREFAILCPNQSTRKRHYRQHDRACNRLLHDMSPFTNSGASRMTTRGFTRSSDPRRSSLSPAFRQASCRAGDRRRAIVELWAYDFNPFRALQTGISMRFPLPFLAHPSYDTASRMLKKSASFVLASLRGSTYRSVRLSPLRSLRPRRTAFLSILRVILTPSP